MTDDFDFMADPFIRTLAREHVSSPDGYQPPEDVKAAQRALEDLVDRRVAGSVKERDYRRLAARYKATVTAHENALLAKHSETAPTSKNGATS